MPKLVTLQEPTSPAAEAFRTLRTNIQFAALEKPVKTLLLSSPAPDEGKSVTAANLAVTLAQAGHRTILVDADLRRPSQHTLWGISNDHGLTTMMLDKTNGEAPLCGVEVEHLAILPSGPLPPNPADLISAPRMDEIIATLAAQADFVLFDAPPLLAVTDAILLGSKVDGVLLIVKAGATRRDHAQRAKEALQRANVRVLGVALTNAPRDASMASYYGIKH